MMETSENIVTFKVRTFVAVVGGLVIGTNVVNTVVHDIQENEKQIVYNADAENRRRNNLEEKINYKIEVAELKKELNDCQDK